MSIFRLEWACKVTYYVQEVGRQCILVGYGFSGAIVAGFLINFVYACMDIIRLQIPDFPPSFSFGWCLPSPVQGPCTILTEVKSLV